MFFLRADNLLIKRKIRNIKQFEPDMVKQLFNIEFLHKPNNMGLHKHSFQKNPYLIFLKYS